MTSRTVATKLVAVAALMLAAVMSLAIAAVLFSRTTGRAAERVYQEGVVQLLVATRLEVTLVRHRKIVESAPAEVDLTVLASNRRTLDHLSAQLHKEIVSVAADLMLQSVSGIDPIAHVNLLVEAGEQTLTFAENFAQDKAHASAREYESLAASFNKLVSDYSARRIAIAGSEVDSLSDSARRLMLWIGVSVLLILFGLLPLGAFVLHDVLRRLATIRSVVHDLAHERVEVQIPYTTEKDEVGELARALELFKANALALLETKQHLAEQNTQLARLSESLELRVEQRTQQARALADAAREASAELARKVDEKTKVEEDLRAANDKLQAATNAKTQFLANMSHEIRTPMNGVLGMCELMLGTALDKRQRHLAQTMRQSASMLLVIINDILDLSRIETGKLELETNPFDLDSCLEGVAAAVGQSAQAKGLDFGVVVDTDVPATIFGDIVRLRQVLLNLVGNAIKFTAKGEVCVRVGFEPGADGAGCLRFSVRDTGIGIDKAGQERLFQSFSQADTSITRKFGGTGLGLAIVKNLVEMMGGHIELDSALGKGTTVSFALPFDRASQIAVSHVAPARPLAQRSIAVLAEAGVRRQAIVSQLLRSGADVTTMTAFEELMARAEDGEHFDVLVLDRLPQGQSFADVVDWLADSLAGTRLVLMSTMGSSAPQTPGRLESGRLVSYPALRTDLVSAALGTEIAAEIAQAQAASAHDGPGTSRQLGLTVLVAEDNPVNQEIAKEFLMQIGCTFVVVENGLEALVAFDARKFDLILMDCQMPQMGGIEATAQIRAREARAGLPATPIIALTANAFPSDADECLASGMNGFLSKPYGQNELEEIIVDVLTGFDETSADDLVGSRPLATAACEHARLMPAE